ncbi:MAG: transposase, partial [Rhodobacteraceae bacterium]|nr:transposase [Paracoccaceae bacterium]
MILLSSIIQTFESEFLDQYQRWILPGHRKALAAMKDCRTRQSPLMLAQCSECDSQVFVPHSCGHRNCPHCQHHESQQWLERQLKKQLPTEYFLVTFTLPAELRPLAKVFRAKMLEAITREGLELPARYPESWVVDCTSVGSGDQALVYLGRYLYRGVIQENDILACQEGKVSFRYQNSKTKQMEVRTVCGATFLWLILQHVLPKGFRRARNFGFLHPNSKRLIGL